MFCNKCGNEVADNGQCPHCNPTHMGHHGHVHHHLPTSGLAVASMILGICSIVFNIFTAIPALILGIIALTQIKDGRSKGKGMAVTGIVLGCIFPCIFIIAVLAGMLLPALGSAREKARRIACTSNLKQIGLSLKQYAMDYNDSFPEKANAAGLEQLRANDYLTDYGVYTCPSTTTIAGTGTEPLTPNNCDYIYLSGFMEGSSYKNNLPDIPIAFDVPSDHRNYINILFQDGHVQGFSTGGQLHNATDVVNFLNKQIKYSPKHLKVLYDKAAKVDAARLKK